MWVRNTSSNTKTFLDILSSQTIWKGCHSFNLFFWSVLKSVLLAPYLVQKSQEQPSSRARLVRLILISAKELSPPHRLPLVKNSNNRKNRKRSLFLSPQPLHNTNRSLRRREAKEYYSSGHFQTGSMVRKQQSKGGLVVLIALTLTGFAVFTLSSSYANNACVHIHIALVYFHGIKYLPTFS